MAYPSSVHNPKTLTIVDTRTSETIFTIDIPVGKQLVIDFEEGQGDDPLKTPDLMRYRIFDLGVTIGKLDSAITVPPASSRRVDVDIRQGPETQS